MRNYNTNLKSVAKPRVELGLHPSCIRFLP